MHLEMTETDHQNLDTIAFSMQSQRGNPKPHARVHNCSLDRHGSQSCLAMTA